MIITKEVEIELTSKNVLTFEKLGYQIPRYFDQRYKKWKFKRGDKIIVKVEDLSPNGQIKVLCACNVCGKERWLKMQCSHKLCHDCADSSKERNQKISQKLKGKPKSKTHLDNVRKSLISLGYWKNEEERNELKNYRLKVLWETRKHLKELFEKWDGKDFYNGEILLTDKSQNQNKMYRTVDHIISVNYGLKHNIDPKEIGKLENLCICSRSTNSKKNDILPIDFINERGL